jgi:hypothetical protein
VCKLIGHVAAAHQAHPFAALLAGRGGLGQGGASKKKRKKETGKTRSKNTTQSKQTNPIEERSGSPDQVDFFLVKLNTG